MIEQTTQTETELARLPVTCIQDVLLARMVVRQESARMGFPPQLVTQIATATSEITRNVVEHSGGVGQARILEVAEPLRRGLKIAVQDTGSGIPEVKRVLAGTSPGAGIPGCRRVMDEFGITSESRRGTTVTMLKWLPLVPRQT